MRLAVAFAAHHDVDVGLEGRVVSVEGLVAVVEVEFAGIGAREMLFEVRAKAGIGLVSAQRIG